MKKTITDNQPYMIIMRNIDNQSDVLYFDNEYRLIQYISKKNVTESVTQTYDFFEENEGLYQWDKIRCDYTPQYDVGRI